MQNWNEVKPPLFAIALAICLSQSSTLAAPDPLADPDFRQARFLFDHKRQADAQKLLLQLCRRPNATAPMYELLGETFLVLGGVDRDAPGLQEAESGLLIGIKKDPGF